MPAIDSFPTSLHSDNATSPTLIYTTKKSSHKPARTIKHTQSSHLDLASSLLSPSISHFLCNAAFWLYSFVTPFGSFGLTFRLTATAASTSRNPSPPATSLDLLRQQKAHLKRACTRKLPKSALHPFAEHQLRHGSPRFVSNNQHSLALQYLSEEARFLGRQPSTHPHSEQRPSKQLLQDESEKWYTSCKPEDGRRV